ncbi:lasso peptide biosynthesis PqqD family chaperone [Metabacillus indicus]|uniref:Metallophosphoesterase n=1 Tax=Metabacillus indicus TaxID=246786 RepID=A0A084H4G3_METID|nr:lasso peptide biosynthesis PqqD family chaperone [Metabacillus indicus]KEZ50319.1 metallophosphoesterase [Metabacillus indicus LMG 22858]KEZ54475.1 metallophosphoesterase [Metabacillus indicus]
MINTMKINMSSQVKQKEGNIVSRMNDEIVMMNIDKGNYYNLGTVGGEIWNKIEHECNVSEVVSHLTSIYEITKKKCEVEVIVFLNKLYNEDLVEIIKH